MRWPGAWIWVASWACASNQASEAPPPSPPPPEAAPSVVAVFDVEDGSEGLSVKEVQQLGDYLAVRIASIPRTRVVPRDQLRGAIASAKAESYRACFDQSCQIELGKAMSAEKSVSTKLLRIGSRCAMTIAWFDLKTETAERAASTKTDCGADALLAAVDDLVHQLGGAPAGAGPSRVTTRSLDDPPRPAPSMVAEPKAIDLVLDDGQGAPPPPPSPAPEPKAAEPAPPAALRVVARGNERVVVLPHPVTFERGRDELSAGAKKSLAEAAAAILRDARLKDERLEIVGYADPNERGKAELSERRARNTRTYLMTQGLTLSRLGLVASADADPDRAQPHHRRVELRLELPE